MDDQKWTTFMKAVTNVKVVLILSHFRSTVKMVVCESFV